MTNDTTFTWSAWLLNSQNYPKVSGRLDLAIAATPNAADSSVVRVASLSGTDDPDHWVFRSVTFSTPANATDYKHVLIIPRSDVKGAGSYVAIDNMSLKRTEALGPVVKEVTPAGAAPGDTILVSGIGLGSTRAVAIGGLPAKFVVDATGNLLVTVPDPALEGAVSVYTTEGTATSPGWLQLALLPEPPALTSFFPESGAPRTQVTLNGQGLMAVMEVRFGGVPAEFEPLPGSRLLVTVPAEAQTSSFELAYAQGVLKSDRLFEVSSPPPPPVVSGLEPNAGPAGTQVTLQGTGFSKVQQVTFAGVSALFEQRDANTLNAPG